MSSPTREPRIDPNPGDVIGTIGPGGKKAKCTGILLREVESDTVVYVEITWTKDAFTGETEGHRTLDQWRRMALKSEVLHVAQ